MCDALRGHPSLREMHMSQIGLTDEHMTYLHDAVIFNSVLQVLNLSMNQIDNRGVGKLMDALRINSVVQEIELWGNKMSDEKKAMLYLKCKDRLAV
jgi:hypothetical protein